METNTNTNHTLTSPKTIDEVCMLLVKKREELNLSQMQIARLVGIKMNSSISRIENGHQKIPRGKITEFAKAYQLNEDTLAPLVSSKRGRPIGENINNDNADLDVFPLIKKVVASNRKELTVAELNTLIKGYIVLQKSVENFTPELRDLLLGTLDALKTEQ